MAEDKLWMFSYKNASASAKLLAEKLDVWLIKHEGSEFRGKNGQFILNWGAGTGVYNAKTGAATVLNPPHLIDVAVNKLSWFNKMTDANGPRVPVWTTSIRQAKHWIGDDHDVVCRTQVEGCKGVGIVVASKVLDIVQAPLYTIKVGNVAEYRVYMFKDEVIDVRHKRGKADANGMMVGDGIEFPPMPEGEEVPADVLKQAIKAAKALPLDLQGLDVIWDGRKAWVLETNTAPYLGIQTAKKYAARIAKFVAEAA